MEDQIIMKFIYFYMIFVIVIDLFEYVSCVIRFSFILFCYLNRWPNFIYSGEK